MSVWTLLSALFMFVAVIEVAQFSGVELFKGFYYKILPNTEVGLTLYCLLGVVICIKVVMHIHVHIHIQTALSHSLSVLIKASSFFLFSMIV